MRVAVAGGTGVAGRLVVAALQAGGHSPVVLARAAGVDLVTGCGLDPTLLGAEVVIDAAGLQTTRRATSVGFFEQVTRRLLDAGARAGVRHHVVLSIVGIDRVDLGYYEGKRRQEQLALASGRPVSVLRTTQFHEFAGQVLDRGLPGPLAVVPRMRVQPIAAQEVAQALVDLALGPAQGRVPDLGGPEQHELPDLARRVLARRGCRARVLAVRLPGSAGRAMASGALLTRSSDSASDGVTRVRRSHFEQNQKIHPPTRARTGATRFDDWLAQT